MVMGEPGAHPGYVGLSAGTLDDPDIFKPQAAVFARSQRQWDKTKVYVPSYDTVPSG